jgi:hypothetical protein
LCLDCPMSSRRMSLTTLIHYFYSHSTYCEFNLFVVRNSARLKRHRIRHLDVITTSMLLLLEHARVTFQAKKNSQRGAEWKGTNITSGHTIRAANVYMITFVKWLILLQDNLCTKLDSLFGQDDMEQPSFIVGS